jgi:hypothetical protein
MGFKNIYKTAIYNVHFYISGITEEISIILKT